MLIRLLWIAFHSAGSTHTQLLLQIMQLNVALEIVFASITECLFVVTVLKDNTLEVLRIKIITWDLLYKLFFVSTTHKKDKRSKIITWINLVKVKIFSITKLLKWPALNINLLGNTLSQYTTILLFPPLNPDNWTTRKKYVLCQIGL